MHKSIAADGSSPVQVYLLLYIYTWAVDFTPDKHHRLPGCIARDENERVNIA